MSQILANLISAIGLLLGVWLAMWILEVIDDRKMEKERQFWRKYDLEHPAPAYKPGETYWGAQFLDTSEKEN